MSSKKKKAALEQKYNLLRSLSNSNAANKASILVDASKHIQELKEKAEKLLNQDTSSCSYQVNSSIPNSDEDNGTFPKVSVEKVEKGFLVNVVSERSCPGLLVSILEAFEELGLQVLDAKAFCSDYFELEALGEKNEELNSLDAHVVKQAVLQAINSWSGNA